MAYIVGNIAERNLYLTLADVPALGVQPTDVVCRIRKEGQNALTTKTLDASSWIELGNGFYVIRFSGADMSVIGTFFYQLTSTKFDNFLYDDFTIEPQPSGAPITPAGFCTVNGNLLTINNTVPANTRITFRPVEFPMINSGAIITADAIVTYPDISGNFSVNLLQGMTVLVEIEKTGLRAQISIPIASSANLADLLPPFPIM